MLGNKDSGGWAIPADSTNLGLPLFRPFSKSHVSINQSIVASCKNNIKNKEHGLRSIQ